MILISNIKKSNTTAIALTFIFAILSWITIFFSDSAGIKINDNTTSIFNGMSVYLGAENCILLCKLIAFLLVVAQAILVNIATNTHRFLGEHTFMPGLIYIILVANLYNYQYLDSILIANIFFILAWVFIAGMYNQSDNRKTIFNASIVLGLASLFYTAYVYFLLFIVVAILLNGANSFRYIIMSIFGFCTVWYLYFSLHYILGDSFQFKEIFKNFVNIDFNIGSITLLMLVFDIFIILLFIISSANLLLNISGNKIFIRRNVNLFFVWIILGILVWIVNPASKEIFYSISIPASILLSMSFVSFKNKFIREILWLLLIVFTIFNRLYI